MSETPYVESNALLAIMRGDTDAADEMLSELHLGELQKLATAAGDLSWAAREAARDRNRPIPTRTQHSD